MKKLVVLSTILAACGGPVPNQGTPRHSVAFTVTADGEPLRGVRILANGEELGQSGVQGTVHAVLEGREGSQVQITYQCPEGYRATEEAKVLSLVTFRSLDPDVSSGLRLQLECEPTVRHAAFIVEVGRAGIPVLVNDQEQAITNEAGVAHVLMESAPGASFRVSLATADFPRLSPQNPRRSFRMGARSDVFVFQQEFEEAPEPRPTRRRRRRRRRASPMGITRIN